MYITTGRRLSEGLPNTIDNVIVMLDIDCSFKNVDADDKDIYWSAYIGTPVDILVSGKLKELMEDIERLRSEARERKGWIMDTYLLRKTAPR